MKFDKFNLVVNQQDYIKRFNMSLQTLMTITFLSVKVLHVLSDTFKVKVGVPFCGLDHIIVVAKWMNF